VTDFSVEDGRWAAANPAAALAFWISERLVSYRSFIVHRGAMCQNL
jgi:hypothetical protein